MLNYNKIIELLGAPLNTVGRTNIPFKLKPWHLIGGLFVVYIMYKGVKSIKKDYFLINPSKIKKDFDTE